MTRVTKRSSTNTNPWPLALRRTRTAGVQQDHYLQVHLQVTTWKIYWHPFNVAVPVNKCGNTFTRRTVVIHEGSSSLFQVWDLNLSVSCILFFGFYLSTCPGSQRFQLFGPVKFHIEFCQRSQWSLLWLPGRILMTMHSARSQHLNDKHAGIEFNSWSDYLGKLRPWDNIDE